MRTTALRNLGLLIAAVTGAPAFGQAHSLAENPVQGEYFRFTAETTLTGTLKVARDGKQVPVRIAATNEHVFVEKVLLVEKGKTRKTARHYLTAASRATVDGDRVERALSAERRLVIAQRTNDALFCYAPAGPLARPELEVVSGHFETLDLVGVLPGKDVEVGDTWKLDSLTAQSICLFDGLISHDLSAKVTGVSGGTATFAITGTAKGIENGALATVTVTATVQFDISKKRIVAVEWKQKDVRDQGPVSPAAEVETTTTLKRELLDQEPAELSATALASVPAGTDTPALTQYLIHKDPRGRFQFLHGRDWHAVGQTDHHLILRLLDRGDFVAQATLTHWKNAGAGKHVSPDEFETLVSAGRGWKAEQVLDRSEVPTDDDRWVYRIVARGELDGNKVVQNFYVIATATGEQMIVTFTMKPSSADRLGTRDVALVNAIEFAKK